MCSPSSGTVATCSVKTVVIWSCPSPTSSCTTRCWSATPATTCSWSPAPARSAASSSRRPSPQPPAERGVAQHGPPRLCPTRFGMTSRAPRCNPNLLWFWLRGRGEMRRSFCAREARFGNGDTLWDCLRGGNEDGDSLGWKWQQGRFSCRTNPFWSKTFSAWIAAASGCLHVAQSSSGAPSETHLQPVHPLAESPTFSTKTPAPSFQTPSRTSEDNRSPSHVSGTPKPLPVLLEAFNFKKKRIAATVFKSLILYSYFVHY